MDSREKFNAVMDNQDNTPILKAEFAYWAGTIRRWLTEGLPEISPVPVNILDSEPVRGSKSISTDNSGKTDENVMSYFGLDSYLEKFPFDISPMLEQVVLSEDESYRTYRDSFGLTNRISKKVSGIPMVLDYPIKDRKSFNKYISAYDEDFSKRLPDDFEKLAGSLKNRDFPIRLGGNPLGFSFLARHLMGEVRFMMNMYDDPGLIKDFNSFFLDFVMKYWDMILKKIDIDCIFILEDIAYRSGSFISKEMFEEFLKPYYIKFIDYLAQYRIRHIFVDCDGLIDELIPLWVEVGVNGIFPIEAVNDLEKISRDFPGLKLMGGFDKKVLFQGSDRKAIDQELEKIKRVMDKGKYIPHIDHAVSEDVSWKNFKYYRNKLNDMCDGK
jgi:uroporphyrinogen decarboxylase